jgi:MFS superfamily sulfate permease-like transporter
MHRTTQHKTELKRHWKADIASGFLVFLIALPLSLGISMASGFPPIAGIFSAIIGGLVVSLIGGSQLTIKGPAAGLIVIAFSAVTELGQGDPLMGYRLTLAVIVVAGVFQVLFGVLKSGILSDFFPSSAVHGMLAAIGVIILAKQAHVMLGVKPVGQEPLELLAEIPHSIVHSNPGIGIIGMLSLLILIVLPELKSKFWSRLPGPMIVILVAIPLGLYFDLGHEHKYLFPNHHVYDIGPRFLVELPSNMFSAITFPDFSQILSATSIKYVIMFALVGSLESLLSTKAVDLLDPYKRKANMNRDLTGVGIGNMLSGFIGGLPMISEIVRSSANINNGARTYWANIFHGLFLFVFVAFLPELIHQIPLAALAAMLVYTGYRLAAPREFFKTFTMGGEQTATFLTTFIVTLATDLLLGIAAGILVKFLMHLRSGLPLRLIFKPKFSLAQHENEYVVDVQHSAVFSNYISLKKSLDKIPRGQRVVVDFTNAQLVDFTVMENLRNYQREYKGAGGEFVFQGYHHLHHKKVKHLHDEAAAH